MAGSITLHLRAADGATHDLVIPGVMVAGPPVIRSSSAVLYSPQSVHTRTAGGWQPPPPNPS